MDSDRDVRNFLPMLRAFTPEHWQRVKDLLHLNSSVVSNWKTGRRNLCPIYLRQIKALLELGLITIHSTMVTRGVQQMEYCGLDHQNLNGSEPAILALPMPTAIELFDMRMRLLRSLTEWADLSSIANHLPSRDRAVFNHAREWLRRVNLIEQDTRKAEELCAAEAAKRLALKEIDRRRQRFSAVRIIEDVARELNVSLVTMLSPRRSQHLNFARQVAMYLVRKIRLSSYPETGRYFERHHSTVVHAYRVIEKRVKEDKAFGLWLKQLEHQVTGAPDIEAAA